MSDDRRPRRGRPKEERLIADDFSDQRRAGHVVGSTGPSGARRLGADRERILSIDHGALRIAPPAFDGWGRHGLSYGPLSREPGLAFAAVVLNGHHASASGDLGEPLRRRLRRWLSGSEAKRARHRLVAWLQSPRKRTTLRTFARWTMTARGLVGMRSHAARRGEGTDNLALGFFDAPAPDDPWSGHALVVRSAGSNNGDLDASIGAERVTVARRIPNVPLLLVAVARERGCAFYGASVEGARGLAAAPYLCPLGIDPRGVGPSLFAGLHQRVLGQIGFRADTRVQAVRVVRIADWAAWCGSAHAADRLVGDGPLGRAERGGPFVIEGEWRRSGHGARSAAAFAGARLDPGEPSGLLHALVEPAEGEVMLRFRCRGEDELRLVLRAGSARLDACVEGTTHTIATAEVATRGEVALMVRDDGERIDASVDGHSLGACEMRLADATGVGFAARGSASLRDFEAHARVVRMPPELDLAVPALRRGGAVRMVDDFDGSEGDLAVADRRWNRILGRGVLERGGGCVRVRATAKRPNPGRTLYAIDWDEPGFADLRVDITTPGPAGAGERSRAGLVFEQDADNYLVVALWLDDATGGPSVSSFLCIDGFEELYDAIWSNVGDRLGFGARHELRASFDGVCYSVWLDGEPVLYRALTDWYADAHRLDVRRVGIAVNWEWGDDTGTTFHRFEARGS